MAVAYCPKSKNTVPRWRKHQTLCRRCPDRLEKTTGAGEFHRHPTSISVLSLVRLPAQVG